MGPTEALARFAVETSYESLPRDLIAATKPRILDTFGVAVAGCVEPAGRISIEYARQMGSAPQATVIGGGFRAAAPLAAFANGTSGHALDYDDTHMVAGGHISVAVLPAAVAVAELLGSSGRKLIEAFILGFEVEARIGAAIMPEHYIRGFHTTGSLGVFGAAVAASKLLGLDVEQARVAIGLAASQSCGLRGNWGTMAKPFHSGDGAQGGVTSALLAKMGFTAQPDMLERPLGLAWATSGQGNYDFSRATEKLGEHWELLHGEIATKFHPCNTASHAPIETTLELVREHNFQAEDVESVEIGITELANTMITFQEPVNQWEAKYSHPFGVAVAIVDRKAGLAQYTDEKCRDPRVRELMRKVRVYPHPEVTAHANKGWGSGELPHFTIHYRMRLKGGREFVKWVETVKGYPGWPLTRHDFLGKYRENVARVMTPEQAEQSIALFDDLENLPEIGSLVQLAGGATTK